MKNKYYNINKIDKDGMYCIRISHGITRVMKAVEIHANIYKWYNVKPDQILNICVYTHDEESMYITICNNTDEVIRKIKNYIDDSICDGLIEYYAYTEVKSLQRVLIISVLDHENFKIAKFCVEKIGMNKGEI